MVARPDTAQHIVHEITALMPCYDSGCRILEISVLILIPTEKGFISPLAQAAMVEPSMQEDKKRGKVQHAINCIPAAKFIDRNNITFPCNPIAMSDSNYKN